MYRVIALTACIVFAGTPDERIQLADEPSTITVELDVAEQDLSILLSYPNLRRLTLRGPLLSLLPVSQLEHLGSLTLVDTVIRDELGFSPLAEMGSLRTLQITSTSRPDRGLYKAIRHLTGLTKLVLDIPPGRFIDNSGWLLKALEVLPHLEHLTLPAVDSSGLEFVYHLTKLKSLRIRSMYIWTGVPLDLTPLVGLPLETLSIAGAPIESIEPIATLTSLKSLKLTFVSIVDLTPLADLVNLRELRLTSSSSPSVTSVAPLVNLLTLEHLGLIGFWGFSDLSSLENHTNLKTLNLAHSKSLKSMGVVKGLTQLEELVINYTGITSLEDISELVKLRKLDFFGTGISDITPLARLLQLEMKATDAVNEDQARAQHPNLKVLTRLELPVMPASLFQHADKIPVVFAFETSLK